MLRADGRSCTEERTKSHEDQKRIWNTMRESRHGHLLLTTMEGLIGAPLKRRKKRKNRRRRRRLTQREACQTLEEARAAWAAMRHRVAHSKTFVLLLLLLLLLPRILVLLLFRVRTQRGDAAADVSVSGEELGDAEEAETECGRDGRAAKWASAAARQRSSALRRGPRETSGPSSS